jgi:P-type Ca2+ transporter type 2C
MIEVTHAIRGRARFKVAGLRGDQALAGDLERELWKYEGITRVSANAISGRVLVLFSSEYTAEHVAGRIERIAAEYGSGRGREAKASCVHTRLSLRKDESPLPWHAAESGYVVRHFGTSPSRGLSEKTAADRLALHGRNALPGTVSRSLSDIFLGQIKSLPVLLTGGAAGVSLLTGSMAGGLLAFAVALVNAAIGTVTELRAEKSLEVAREVLDLRARILRNRRIREIPFEECVRGDILDLQAGSRVPADARLISVFNLSLDESALTGESIPVEKKASTLGRRQTPISQRRNMIYRGTLVVEGTGRAVVVATGKETVLGRLQGFLGEVLPPEAVMARDLKRVAWQFVFVGLGAWSILAVVSLFRGMGFLQILREGLSFVAGVLPSGLSTLAVSAFALGHRDMRRSRILVRRLRALGNLASVNVVCFDKTGTLTHNRMAVTELCVGEEHVRIKTNGIYDTTGLKRVMQDPRFSRLVRLSVLCNQAAVVVRGDERFLEGSPTEKALMELAEGAGFDPSALREESPVTEVRQRTEDDPFMVTVHRLFQGGRMTAVKGSPLEVLECCSFYQAHDHPISLGEKERLEIEAANFRMAGKGLRVLGIAYFLDGNGDHDPGAVINGRRLVWSGLVGLEDPVRKEAKELIQALHRAGIKTAVITGDQSLTAQHIGEALNLSGDEPLRILDVVDLKGLDHAGLKTIVQRTHVFARLNPTQKLQIIQTYQNTGRGVVMVGDGINDVLALKVADVGIAMGKEGTDLARRAADLVLEDDDLNTVIVAVASGRAFFENMRRSLRYLSTTSYADILANLATGTGAGAGPGVWQSVWTNLACLSLAVERADSTALDRPPLDPREGLMTGQDMSDTLGDAVKMIAAAGPAGVYGLAGKGGAALFSRSLSVNQLLYALSCREKKGKPAIEKSPNRMLSLTLFGALGGYGILTLLRWPAGLLDAAALCLSGLLARALMGDQRIRKP